MASRLHQRKGQRIGSTEGTNNELLCVVAYCKSAESGDRDLFYDGDVCSRFLSDGRLKLRFF